MCSCIVDRNAYVDVAAFLKYIATQVCTMDLRNDGIEDNDVNNLSATLAEANHFQCLGLGSNIPTQSMIEAQCLTWALLAKNALRALMLQCQGQITINGCMALSTLKTCQSRTYSQGEIEYMGGGY